MTIIEKYDKETEINIGHLFHFHFFKVKIKLNSRNYEKFHHHKKTTE